MDQKAIGTFLKTLRQEKGMTQEQLAEEFCVSNRTVSRWETGSNLPDLGVLLMLSEFYSVDVKEIINGKRQDETMNEKEKETLEKVAEYTEAEKERLRKRMLDLCSGTLLLLVFSLVLYGTNGFGWIPQKPVENMVSFTLGATTAILVLNIIYLKGWIGKIRSFLSRKG